MTRPLPPIPGGDLLTRHLTVPPSVLRPLRAVRRTRTVHPAALAASRQRVADLVALRRAAGRANPQRAARLAVWQGRRARLAARLARVVADQPRRTPDRVLADLLAVAITSRTPGARAVVIVRSAASVATVDALLGTGATVHALMARGMRLRPLRRLDEAHRYALVLPVAAQDLGREIDNVAWAVGAAPAVVAARPDCRTLRLFADELSSAAVAPAEFAWHIDMIRAEQAHDVPPGVPGGRRRGAGSVIAHPDTGWAPHPQYDRQRIDTAHSYNTATNRSGGTEARHGTVPRPFGSPNLTHGTATGCLMVGGDGSGPTVSSLTDVERVVVPPVVSPVADSGRIVGVAPAATVVPIKFLSDALVDVDDRGVAGAGVLRVGDGDFEEAIGYARRIGADVMSLSVGGILSEDVRTALVDAIWDTGMIVVAAAGQTYAGNPLSALSPDDSVVEPARFSDVIAVAGCSTNGRPWAESLRGPNVDITAPSDAVWVADFAGDVPRPVLRAGSGTSFGTAIVAGAAAAWLAHWGGREALRAQYPGTPLAWVFRDVLQRSARSVDGTPWDTTRFGAGVLDVEHLLRTPLPAADRVPRPPATRANLLDGLEAGLTALHDVVEAIDDAAKAAAAAALVLAGLLESAVDDLAEDLAHAGAVAGAVTAEIVAAGEALLADAVDAAEDMAEKAAEQGEAALDTLVDGAEKAAAAGGEAIDAVLGWFGS